jgi:hypothetical protein
MIKITESIYILSLCSRVPERGRGLAVWGERKRTVEVNNPTVGLTSIAFFRLFAGHQVGKKIVWVCFVSGLVKQPVKRKYKKWGKNFFFFLKNRINFQKEFNERSVILKFF